MALPKSGIRVKRWPVVGMEGMWAKMFDPPTESPATPDRVAPTNPVPEVMLSAGHLSKVSTPHTVERDLMHGLNIPTWDNRKGGMMFFLIRDADNPLAVGTFPGPTLRVPRGVVFHAHTKGHGPPPHTIHWHGIEPTPMNDGVGHCSMEIGDYTYQWQPNFIGSYFYHCHRNTVQHFEFGLYGFLVIEPPDAYWATLKDPTIPIGHCRDGKRRTAANLTGMAKFTDVFRGGDITDPDPLNPTPAVADPANLKFITDPHAMTVAYDVEALWVFDDRDSVWSDMAPDARATYPAYGSIPGVNDEFQRNPGKNGFFAFNDFHPDYFYVTGVPVPAHRLDKGGTGVGRLPTEVVIPAELNSGVSGTQVSINAKVGDNILLRCLDGAYACTEITFPVDVTVIAWDGRALGVPPYGQYNHAYAIPANTPFRTSVARRFDALIRSDVEVHGVATVKFINTRGEQGGANNLNFDVLPTGATPHGSTIQPGEEVLLTAEIPINIGAIAPGVVTSAISGTVADAAGAPVAGVTIDVEPMSLGGTGHKTAVTDAAGNFSVPGLINSMYEITPSLNGVAFEPIMDPITGMPGRRVTLNGQNVAAQNFTASAAAGISVTLTPDKQSPQPPNTPGGVTFSASAQGVTGPIEYQFKLDNAKVQDYSTNSTWTWNTAALAIGVSHTVKVSVRPVGVTTPLAERSAFISYKIDAVAPTTANTNIKDDYTLEEILDSLKMAVGTKNPTLADLQRFDVAPLVNGIQQLDGKIDIMDVLVMLRKHVGLPL